MKKTLTKQSKELLVNSKILEEIDSLIDSIQFEDRLSSNIFKLINKYIKYDVSGLFFNESEESSRNIFNFSFPKNNITIALSETIRDKFFDKMEKYKRINEIQCNLIDGNIKEKSKIKYSSFTTKLIIPYEYTEKLTGGLFIGLTRELKPKEKEYLSIIKKELDKIFRIKYLFNEQARI